MTILISTSRHQSFAQGALSRLAGGKGFGWEIKISTGPCHWLMGNKMAGCTWRGLLHEIMWETGFRTDEQLGGVGIASRIVESWKVKWQPTCFFFEHLTSPEAWKLTSFPWKWMVGRWLNSFIFFWGAVWASTSWLRSMVGPTYQGYGKLKNCWRNDAVIADDSFGVQKIAAVKALFFLEINGFGNTPRNTWKFLAKILASLRLGLNWPGLGGFFGEQGGSDKKIRCWTRQLQLHKTVATATNLDVERKIECRRAIPKTTCRGTPWKATILAQKKGLQPKMKVVTTRLLSLRVDSDSNLLSAEREARKTVQIWTVSLLWQRKACDLCEHVDWNVEVFGVIF